MDDDSYEGQTLFQMVKTMAHVRIRNFVYRGKFLPEITYLFQCGTKATNIT